MTSDYFVTSYTLKVYDDEAQNWVGNDVNTRSHRLSGQSSFELHSPLLMQNGCRPIGYAVLSIVPFCVLYSLTAYWQMNPIGGGGGGGGGNNNNNNNKAFIKFNIYIEVL